MSARASARFVSADLDPSDVTRALLLPPDVAIRAGDPNLGRTRRGAVLIHAPYTKGVWSMSSGEWVQAKELAPHIEWVLRQLEERADQVKSMIGRGIKGDILCFWSAPHAPNIPKALRERAAALGLSIEVDLYSKSASDRPELDAP